MKKTIGLALAVLMAVSLLAGGAQAASEAPERFAGEWDGVNGLVHVTADAEIVRPETDAIPTAAIERHSFTQEDAERILTALIGESVLYELPVATKVEIGERLERYRAMERGEIPPQGDWIENGGSLTELIAYYERLYEAAPETDEKTPASHNFTAAGGNREQIIGRADVDGKTLYVQIERETSPMFWDEASCFAEGYGDWMDAWAVETESADFPEDAAREAGDKLMESLGLTDTVCDEICPVAFWEFCPYMVWEEEAEPARTEPAIRDTGYRLRYVRRVAGIPLAYTGYDSSGSPENEAFIGCWADEEITVYFTAEGLVQFAWRSPYTQPVVTEEQAALLDFGDIAEVFGKMVMVKFSYLEKANEINRMHTTVDIAVDRVELNLMRIRDKSDITHGRIVPVWDFWGTVRYVNDEGAEPYEYREIALTVNALDGTVVDRDVGF